jgi:hypothetical protein
MNKLVAAVVLAISFAAIATANAQLDAKKGIGISCNKNSECESGYCKPNKAHLPGYSGTCQRR